MANQDIQLRSPGTSAWDITLSSPAGPEEVIFPTKTVAWYKVDGIWRRGIMWIKDSAAWKEARAYIRLQGEWE